MVAFLQLYLFYSSAVCSERIPSEEGWAHIPPVKLPMILPGMNLLYLAHVPYSIGALLCVCIGQAWNLH